MKGPYVEEILDLCMDMIQRFVVKYEDKFVDTFQYIKKWIGLRKKMGND